MSGVVQIADKTTGRPIDPLETPASVVEITCSLDTNIYAAGDVLFATQEIANAARSAGGKVMLNSITVIDLDDQGIAFDLVLLTANSSLGAENAAPDIDDTEVLDVAGVVSIVADDYTDLGGARVATVRDIGLLIEAAAGETSLWAAGITGGTPTHSAAGLKIRFGLLQL